MIGESRLVDGDGSGACKSVEVIEVIDFDPNLINLVRDAS